MLDQKKTGMFICDMRKEKGMTQKQLADEIGVSDKAISKWENGRGMPDTSIMPDLCKVLEINVNELLSGEHLSEEAYSGKAEDNMVKLIKDNEDTKRGETKALIGTILGILLLAVFIYVITIMSGGMGLYVSFLDAPTLIAVLGMQLIALFASGQFYSFFTGLKLVFAPKRCAPDERQPLAEKSEYAVGIGIKMTLMAGALICIIGFVMFMHSMSDPSTIGPNLAVAVLSLFYAALISLFLYVIKGRLHRISEG